MNDSAFSESAARLCSACGMCCNGVLFHGMAVQPEDSLRALAAKGLRARRRDGELQFQQPCPAHDGNCCRIYAERPQRCRAFDCRQLLAVSAGQITEAQAMEKIQEARRRSDRVRELLEMLGDDRKIRPLVTRCAGIFTPPLDPSPHAEALRAELRGAMTALEEVLAKDFRTGPRQ
ncbi:MAG: YkgJ family cysteine cluster protein [Verrucomicrobia bacterium]|nr:YkgJ family cysteine cluster protein [Verrucomicrobiota bacterium]